MPDLQDIKKLQKQRAAMGLPNRGVVASTITSAEQVNVETFGNVGTQKTIIRHPYMGVNSWVRVMPEQGTPVLTQQRGDYSQLEIWGYISNNLSNRHTINKGKSKKTFLFRELQEGEIELMSRGRGYMHLADSGDVEMRGGTVRMALQQTELQTVQHAPTHHRQLHMYDYRNLGHEEKFGVVRRPDPQNPDLVSKFIRNADNTFAVEYSRWLNKKDGSRLVEVQEGDVFDNQGQERKHSTTNKPLRSIRKWFNDQSQELSMEVDEDLNILIANTDTSRETTIKLGRQNVLDVSAKQLKMSFLTSGSLAFTQNVQIRTAKASVVSPNINLGAATAAFPVTMGDKLGSATLTPLFSSLSAIFTTLANSSAFASEQPVQEALKGTANTISGLSSTLVLSLSKTVKVAS